VLPCSGVFVVSVNFWSFLKVDAFSSDDSVGGVVDGWAELDVHVLGGFDRVLFVGEQSNEDGMDVCLTVRIIYAVEEEDIFHFISFLLLLFDASVQVTSLYIISVYLFICFVNFNEPSGKVFWFG
jgi:hypothetical protein